MKTLKSIALAAALLACAYKVAAVDYYTTTKTVTASYNGMPVVYQCYVNSKNKGYIYNSADARYLVNDEYRDYTMKDGSRIPRNPDGTKGTLEMNVAVKELKKAKFMVASGFSVAEKELVKGHDLGITLAITSDGKVAEVRFDFNKTSPYQQIPLSTFINIEKALKAQQYYLKTAKGKQMNYDIAGWAYNFSYPIENPSPTPPPSGE